MVLHHLVVHLLAAMVHALHVGVVRRGLGGGGRRGLGLGLGRGAVGECGGPHGQKADSAGHDCDLAHHF
ncbi:MAG: hypothetical protein B7Z20_00145 [Sphingobium sp. 32-64-5]|nr:hypothetical protein CSW63_01135 [Caulobacter sp. FWC26]OYW89337.1 MAG: hypothetical protein B7Z20_00145 [Sphingobium sp. 32-64-5]PIB96200.1 hypothetical protein CSW60_16805 [Caulobacter sp. X]